MRCYMDETVKARADLERFVRKAGEDGVRLRDIVARFGWSRQTTIGRLRSIGAQRTGGGSHVRWVLR